MESGKNKPTIISNACVSIKTISNVVIYLKYLVFEAVLLSCLMAFCKNTGKIVVKEKCEIGAIKMATVPVSGYLLNHRRERVWVTGVGLARVGKAGVADAEQKFTHCRITILKNVKPKLLFI